MASPRGLAELLVDWGFGRRTTESTWVVASGPDQRIRTIAEISRGGYHSSRVHIAPLLSAVFLAKADRFVLVHNHPSGDVRATPADLDLTQMVLLGSNVAGILLEDHVIVGPRGEFFSLKHEQLYEPPDSDLLGTRRQARRSTRQTRSRGVPTLTAAPAAPPLGRTQAALAASHPAAARTGHS
jgi:hypothetical protein